MNARVSTEIDNIRNRFLSCGANGLRDDEILAVILDRSAIRRDPCSAARALIERFGSFGDALHAPPHRLDEVGICVSCAIDLNLIGAVPQRVLWSKIKDREVLSTWMQVIDYCRAAMAFEEREQFRILFLDKKNALIADEVQQTGTVDHTPVYPREIIKRALVLSATSVILVHNHPSGDPTPSRADVLMTRAIVEAGRHLGIAVFDHIVIGRKRYASMKGLMLI